MKKDLLLTGSSGFIGRNLLGRLGAKHDVSAPSSRELDLTDYRAVERYLSERDFDIVIHAASAGVGRKRGEDGLLERSFGMFMNIARCKKHYGRMIQIGSGAEYDKSRPLVRVREDEFGASEPKDSYGIFKYRCSKHIEGAEGITCLRVFGCYGPYEDYGMRFISNAICKSIFGLPITIANRNVRFSYLYVDDLARIVEHFIGRAGRHKSYNATPDEVTDLLSIARKVNALSGKNLPIIAKNPGMGNEYSGDNSRLRAEMPDFKFTGIDEGIGKLYGWYEQNSGLLDREKLATDICQPSRPGRTYL